MQASGIYEIVNTVNGKRYIGSAKNLAARRRQHFGGLRRQTHHNAKLQAAWNKYGEAQFKFLPILTCQPSMLLFYEQQLLDKVKPEYNLSPSAGTPLGTKHSPQSRANMSAAHKGRGQTPEVLAKMRAANVGRKLSQEQKDKISAGHRARHPEKIGPPQPRVRKSRKGVPHSPEHRAAIAKALKGRPGKPRTPEQIAAVTAKNKGQKRTPEQRANIARGCIGREHPALSCERREAIRKFNTGRKHPHSEEYKIRMSNARKGIPWSAARREAYERKRGAPS